MILELFPRGALDSSVVTTVWIGISIVALFNLRFGMTLSGLVVPGYLVPLLIVKPISALIVVLEGLLAYGLARLFAEVLPKRMGMGEMFGRDRFFAIMLFSVLVRALADGWLLPSFGVWLGQHGFAFDYKYSLHSFGLVIVALIANMMWNGGMWRGLVALGLYSTLTLLVVRYVLMTFTNFSISNLSFMYEDVASNILASPKAYMILLTTAWLASRFNLKYGWDFNGIIIPALIALQWYQPWKLLATLVESFVILFAAQWLLRLPYFAKRNMEGARLLVLFFNIGFFYKLMIGFLLLQLQVSVKTSDLYAFGYLLSTLMAIKMYQKGIATRLTRTTLQTSVVAWLLASAFGFVLSLQLARHSQVAVADSGQHPVRHRNDRVGEVLQRFRADLYQSDQAKASDLIRTADLQTFEAALKILRDDGKNADLNRVANLLGQIEFDLWRVQNHQVIVHDRFPTRGRGLYAINLASKSGWVIEVPTALDNARVAEAAVWLYENESTGGLALAGARRFRQRDGSTDVLSNSQTYFQRFHRVFAARGALQLRALSEKASRSKMHYDAVSVLSVKHAPPVDLNLNRLRETIGPVDVRWQPVVENNQQRDWSRTQFAELQLTVPALRQIIARGVAKLKPAQTEIGGSLEGYLQTRLVDTRNRFAPQGSNAVRRADLGALLFFSDEILTPLNDLAQTGLDLQEPNTQMEIQRIASMAKAIDFTLTPFREASGQGQFLLLSESLGLKRPRHWGSYVWRMGDGAAMHIQVPYPVNEAQTLEYGITLFDRTQARSLSLAGAHRLANTDGSADVLNANFPATVFNLQHQVLLRDQPDAEKLFVQVRGYSSAQHVMPADIVLDYWERKPSDASPLQSALQSSLERDGSAVRVVDGSAETAPFVVGSNAQTRMLSLAPRAMLTSVWVASPVRVDYRARLLDGADAKRFRALGIAIETEDLTRWIQQNPIRTNLPMDARIEDALLHFERHGDVMALVQIQTMRPDLKLRLVLDPYNLQSYLDLRDAKQGHYGIANLHPRQQGEVKAKVDDVKAIRDFRQSGKSWWRVEPTS